MNAVNVEESSGAGQIFLWHQRIHTSEDPFECDMCGQAFNRKSALTVHKQCHPQEKLYECHECRKFFYHMA